LHFPFFIEYALEKLYITLHATVNALPSQQLHISISIANYACRAALTLVIVTMLPHLLALTREFISSQAPLNHMRTQKNTPAGGVFLCLSRMLTA